MKTFQLDEVQFERLEMAQAPQPALRVKAGHDPVREFWIRLGRELGFNPDTVTNFAEDWTFQAEELLAPIQPEASAPAEEVTESAAPASQPALQEAAVTLVSTAVALPAEADDKLALVVRESALPAESCTELLSKFAPLAAEAKRLVATAKTINVVSELQTVEMSMARTTRLALRDVRLRSDKLRVALKADSLRRSKAIDGLHHVVNYLVEAEETRLDEAEKFAERAAAERMRMLAQKRAEELAKYGFNAGQIDLGAMPQEDFDRMLEGQRLAAEAAEKRKVEAKTEERRRKLSVYGISPTAQVMLSPNLGAMTEENFTLLLDEHRRLHAEEQERRRMRGIERFNELGTWGVKYSGTPPLEDLADDVYQKIAADARDAWTAKKNSEKAERDRRDEELRLSKIKSERMIALSRFDAKIEPRLQGGVIVFYADMVLSEQTAAIEALPEEQWAALLVSAKSRFEAQQAKVKAQREKEAAEKKAADDKAAEEKKRADEATAELNRKKREEEAAERKRKAEEAKLARAPDRQKLTAFIKSINSITAPEMKTEAGKFALEVIREQYKLAGEFAVKTIADL